MLFSPLDISCPPKETFKAFGNKITVRQTIHNFFTYWFSCPKALLQHCIYIIHTKKWRALPRLFQHSIYICSRYQTEAEEWYYCIDTFYSHADAVFITVHLLVPSKIRLTPFTRDESTLPRRLSTMRLMQIIAVTTTDNSNCPSSSWICL